MQAALQERLYYPAAFSAHSIKLNFTPRRYIVNIPEAILWRRQADSARYWSARHNVLPFD